MNDGVQVDIDALLSTATRILQLNDTSDQQLRSSDQAISRCSGGFTELAKPGFNGFVDDLNVRRTTLFNRLEHIEHLTRSAANRYSGQDYSSASSIDPAVAAGPSHLNL
jgi:uncharacterized protein YukE